MPSRMIKDFIFCRMLSRLSLDIGWRNPYGDRLLNNWSTASLLVFLVASSSTLAASNLYALSEPTTRSTSGKFLSR